MAYFGMSRAFLKENEGHEALKRDFLDPLKAASKDLQAAAEYFVAEGMKNPNAALAGATDFMHLFGLVGIGHAWAMMARTAHAALEGGTDDTAFYENKLRTGRYFMSRLLPETGLRLARIRSGADPVMALPAEAF